MPKICPIHYRKLMKIFESVGFKKIRERGDHLVCTRQDVSRPIVVPRYKNVPVFIIKKNLKTAEISREEYFKLLKKP